MKTILFSLAVAALVALAVMAPAIAKDAGQRVHSALFGYMVRAGLVLGADVLGRIPTEAAANRKVMYDSQSKSFTAICEMPTTYTAAQNDTVSTGVILKKGTRLVAPVTISNGTNTASLTLAVGLRDPVTKVAIDATALAAATAITTAACAQVNTGTKLTAGQRYVLTQDAEIYFTLAAAAPTANAAIRVEVPYLAA